MARLYLEISLWEVMYASNRGNNYGLQNRRNAEALLLNTYDREIIQSRRPEVINQARSALQTPQQILMPTAMVRYSPSSISMKMAIRDKAITADAGRNLRLERSLKERSICMHELCEKIV